MHFDDQFKQKVKENNPLLDLMQEYGEVKQQGKYYKMYCPLPHHDDSKDPSFTYHPDQKNITCYGCGTHIKDSIEFIQVMEGLNFREAVFHLVEKANINLPDDEYSEEMANKRKFRQGLKEKSRLFWKLLMEKESGQKAKDYLVNERQITPELINKFRLGYCDFRFTNLSKSNENYRFKKFTNRIMFTILDHRGLTVGFSGRTLPDEEDEYAKYHNSSDDDNPLFNKRELLYGLYNAKIAISKLNYAIIVEGFTDVILAHKYGVENIVGSMGTALTDEQAKLLSRFTDNVILFLDADSDSDLATKQTINNLKNYNLTIKAVTSNDDKDPADMALELEDDLPDWITKKAKLIEQYYVDNFISDYDAQIATAKERLIKKARDKFGGQLDNLDTEIALNPICERLNISIDTLKQELKEG